MQEGEEAQQQQYVCQLIGGYWANVVMLGQLGCRKERKQNNATCESADWGILGYCGETLTKWCTGNHVAVNLVKHI